MYSSTFIGTGTLWNNFKMIFSTICYYVVILTIRLVVIQRPMSDSAIKLSTLYFSEVLEAYGAFISFSKYYL